MYRILLVDDDQNIVDGLGSIIKQNFENIFVISSACDGSDALKRLQRPLSLRHPDESGQAKP